ncbi:hypothetical protein HPP92_016256 [Vanilla planifolia]|uniref:SHSP domain-containing protein n=1 Tax=Vanilla planifolia TaxID=51239 RepID=A0A835URZ3_VANPL|nr:hypothetical protein HPP92_016256 [Vanilla planifolia]
MPSFNNALSVQPSKYASETAAFANTRIDWKETPEAHVFKADLPGLKKEEVKISLENVRLRCLLPIDAGIGKRRRLAGILGGLDGEGVVKDGIGESLERAPEVEGEGIEKVVAPYDRHFNLYR